MVGNHSRPLLYPVLSIFLFVGSAIGAEQLSFLLGILGSLILQHLSLLVMTKEAPSQSVTELNACVSTGHRPAVKETTFREWVVDNQIGTYE